MSKTMIERDLLFRSNTNGLKRRGGILPTIWARITSGQVILRKKVTKLQILRMKTLRRFLATSGDKMLTLFEELKGSDASPELVQVKNLIFWSKKSFEWKAAMRLKLRLSKVDLAQIFTHKRVAFTYIQLIFFICILNVFIHIGPELVFPGFRGRPVIADQGCEKYWMWAQPHGGHVQQVRCLFLEKKQEKTSFKILSIVENGRVTVRI